jgi:hypothetical protein
MDVAVQVGGVSNITEMMEHADNDERFQCLQLFRIQIGIAGRPGRSSRYRMAS